MKGKTVIQKGGIGKFKMLGYKDTDSTGKLQVIAQKV